MSLLAVDLGSSTCKAVVFSEAGCALAQKSCSYPLAESPYPSWAEMPAQNFWNALVAVCRGVSGEVKGDPIEGLAISSHGETFIPVDDEKRPIGPAILNCDNRAIREAKWIEEKIGRDRLFDITGLVAHPMYPVAKILWLKKHQADLYDSASQFLGVPDYLSTQMGLPALIDYSLASRCLAFDVRRREWASEILETCELEPHQFAKPVPAGTATGELPASSASELGLQPGTPVVVGGHDQPCAALGSGVLAEGRISASLGTYECLVAASHRPAPRDKALPANLNTYCHVIPERYVTLAFFPAGIMVDWFVRMISGTGCVDGLHSQLEAEVSEGPTGVCVTPHLLGTCTPDFDPAATGVIAGLHPKTTRAEVYKGILEGIGCEFAEMAKLLQAAIGPVKDVYVSGGGVRSRLGLQLRAAMSGCSLHVLKQSEAVCLGTAILAGVAIGKYKSIEQAVEGLVAVAETVAPDPAVANSYREQSYQYHGLYSSLAPWRDEQRTVGEESE